MERLILRSNDSLGFFLKQKSGAKDEILSRVYALYSPADKNYSLWILDHNWSYFSATAPSKNFDHAKTEKEAEKKLILYLKKGPFLEDKSA